MKINTMLNQNKADKFYISNQLEHTILNQIAPTCVLLDFDFKVLHCYGDCKDFINTSEQIDGNNFLTIVKSDLKLIVEDMLKSITNKKDKVCFYDIPLKLQDSVEYISITAQYLNYETDNNENLIILIFVFKENQKSIYNKKLSNDLIYEERISSLEKELRDTKEQLNNLKNEITNSSCGVLTNNDKNLHGRFNNASIDSEIVDGLYSFVGRLSHDIRTPMAAMNGLIHLAYDVPNLPVEEVEILNKIFTSNKYLTLLIEEIFEVIKLNTKKPTLNKELVSEQELISKCFFDITTDSLKYGVNFIHKINNCQNKWILADKHYVTRLLKILLTNAIKFSDINSRVEFQAYVKYLSNNKVQHTYIVTDFGKGFSEEFHNSMFNYFSDDIIRYTNIMDGTGLFIYIIKKYVELLNGTVDCKSKVGVGTTFTITLEYSTSTVENNEYCMDISSLNINEKLNNKHVLICEDNSINAEILTKLLQKKGVFVEIAKDGYKGIEMFKNSRINHFDAIIMDIVMPHLDGIEAAKIIRSLERSDAFNVPILALTADDSKEDDVINSGMNKCLTKPLDVEVLYLELSKLL